MRPMRKRPSISRKWDTSCPERREAGRTMMGFAQEAWLYSGLAHSKARWNPRRTC